MDKKELQVFNKVLKDKYRFHTLWKVLTIIFACTTIIFAILFFSNAEIFKSTVNDVEVVNESSSDNTNYITINN